jgi:hypothetical protein
MREDLAAASREIEALRTEADARASALRAWEQRGFLRRMLGGRPRNSRKP